MGEKRFDKWNEIKKKVHFIANKLDYHEREIWWYAAGENIGIEINGKGDDFARPVFLSQSRIMSANRLYRKIGRLPVVDYNKVCNKLRILIFKNNTPNS